MNGYDWIQEQLSHSTHMMLNGQVSGKEQVEREWLCELGQEGEERQEQCRWFWKESNRRACSVGGRQEDTVILVKDK